MTAEETALEAEKGKAPTPPPEPAPKAPTPPPDSTGGGSDDIIEGGSPLSGQVKERPYTAGQNLGGADEVIDRVPEPTIQAPPPPPPKPPTAGEPAAGEPPKTPDPYKDPANPDFVHIPQADIQRGAENFVDGALSAYKYVWDLGYKAVAMSPAKLNQLGIEDKISLDLEFPAGRGRTLTVAEAYQVNNDLAKQALTVSDEFINKVRPPMIREFTRRGIGATDMQYLLWTFGEDILQKGSAILILRNDIKGMTDQLKEMHKDVKEQRDLILQSNAARDAELQYLREQEFMRKNPPPPAPVYTPPPPPPTPPPAPPAAPVVPPPAAPAPVVSPVAEPVPPQNTGGKVETEFQRRVRQTSAEQFVEKLDMSKAEQIA